MGKIPLKDLFDYLHMMLNDHWGYIWGTAGIMCTQAVVNRSANNPKNPNPRLTETEGKKWIGHMVTDCSGVELFIWKKYGLTIPHGVNSMISTKKIVDIGSQPIPGYAALIYSDTEKKYKHIGIVAEDRTSVYEAKGTVAGFVKTELAKSKFNRFGRFVDVEYVEVKPMKPPYYAVVNTNSGALNVRSGPSLEDSKIGKVEKGQKVIVKIHGDEWDFISADSLQGYAATRYLMPLEEVPDDPEPEPKPDDEIITIEIPKKTVEVWIRVLTEITDTLKAGGV